MLTTYGRARVGLNSWIIQLELADKEVEPRNLLDWILLVLEQDNVLEGEA